LNGKLNKPKVTIVNPKLGLESATHRPTATTASDAPIHIHPTRGNGTGRNSNETEVDSSVPPAIKQFVNDLHVKKEDPWSALGQAIS